VLCIECLAQPQKTVYRVYSRLNEAEHLQHQLLQVCCESLRFGASCRRAGLTRPSLKLATLLDVVTQICQKCTVTADRDITCISLDCPVYFERVKAVHRVDTAYTLLDAIAELESSL